MLHMHGELQSALCAACGNAVKWEGDMPLGSVCGDCGEPKLRPDIVFFGEMPYEMERIDQTLAKADLLVSVGTSGARSEERRVGKEWGCTFRRRWSAEHK